MSEGSPTAKLTRSKSSKAKSGKVKSGKGITETPQEQTSPVQAEAAVVLDSPWERSSLENQQEEWSSETDDGADDSDTNGKDSNSILRIDREAAKAVDDVGMQVIRNLKKKLFYANNRAVYYGKVLHRRTEVLEEIRKSYLKDVVTLKLIINNILKENERESVIQHYNACIPCIDLRQSLPLHCPESAHMMLKPCEHCGGQLEFLISDSARLVAMRKDRDHYKANEEQLKISNASLEYKLEMRKQDLYVADVNHTNEKAVLYSEMKKFRENADKMEKEIEDLRSANAKLREAKQVALESVSTVNTEMLHEQLALAQKDNSTLTNTVGLLREQIHSNQLELMDVKNLNTRLNDSVKDLTNAKSRVERQLEMITKDLEISQFTVSKLTDQNKDLQKSLTQSNEKLYASERRAAAMEFETNAIKEKANADAEDSMKANDTLRKELQASESKLRVLIDQTKEQKLQVFELEELIKQKDAVIDEMEQEAHEGLANEDSLEDELRALKDFIISNGFPAVMLEDFELQRVMEGGQSLEERLLRRDERAARMDELKDALDAQFERLQVVRTTRKNDSPSTQSPNKDQVAVRRVLPSQVSSPKLTEKEKSASDLSLALSNSEAAAAPPSRSPAPRITRQPSSAVLLSRQVSNALSVASSNGEEQLGEGDVAGKQGRSSGITRLYSIDNRGARVGGKKGRPTGISGGGNFDDEELQPLGANATQIEVNMRRSMLGALIEVLGMGTAKRAVNATAEAVHITSNILNTAQLALWESFLLNRKSLDFYIKIKTILEGMISCTIAGTEIDDVKRVLQDMMSIASMQLGMQFSPEWNSECNLSAPLYAALNAGKAASKGSPEYFNVGTNDRELFDRMEILKNSVSRMTRYGESGYNNIVEYVNENLRDWSDAKICALGFEDALKKEGDRIRAIFNREMDIVKIEAVKLRREVSELLADNECLSKTIEDITADYERVKGLPDEILALNNVIATEKNKQAELIADMDLLVDKQKRFDDQLRAKQNLIDEGKCQQGLLNFKIQVLEKDLDKETKSHMLTRTQLSDTQLELDIVHRRELARWAQGVHELVQTDPPPTADCAVQTEFVVPSLRVKTILKAEEGSRVRYPVAVSAASPRFIEDTDTQRMRENLSRSLDDAMRHRQLRIQTEQYQNYIHQRDQIARISNQRANAHVGFDMSDEIGEAESMSVLTELSMPMMQTDLQQGSDNLSNTLHVDVGSFESFEEGPRTISSQEKEALDQLFRSCQQDYQGETAPQQSRLLGTEIPYHAQGDGNSMASFGTIDSLASSALTPHVSYYSIKKGVNAPSVAALARSISNSHAKSPLTQSHQLDGFRASSPISDRSMVTTKPISLTDFPIITNKSSKTGGGPLKASNKPSNEVVIGNLGPVQSIFSSSLSSQQLHSGLSSGGAVDGWGGKIRASDRPISGSANLDVTSASLSSLINVTSLSANNNYSQFEQPDYYNLVSSRPSSRASFVEGSDINERDTRAVGDLTKGCSLIAKSIQTEPVSLPSISANNSSVQEQSLGLFFRPPSPFQPTKEAALLAQKERDNCIDTDDNSSVVMTGSKRRQQPTGSKTKPPDTSARPNQLVSGGGNLSRPKTTSSVGLGSRTASATIMNLRKEYFGR